MASWPAVCPNPRQSGHRSPGPAGPPFSEAPGASRALRAVQCRNAGSAEPQPQPRLECSSAAGPPLCCASVPVPEGAPFHLLRGTREGTRGGPTGDAATRYSNGGFGHRLAGAPDSTTLRPATSHTSARDRRSPSGDKPPRRVSDRHTPRGRLRRSRLLHRVPACHSAREPGFVSGLLPGRGVGT
jgi:hypothetical protein